MKEAGTGDVWLKTEEHKYPHIKCGVYMQTARPGERGENVMVTLINEDTAPNNEWKFVFIIDMCSWKAENLLMIFM